MTAFTVSHISKKLMVKIKTGGGRPQTIFVPFCTEWKS